MVVSSESQQCLFTNCYVWGSTENNRLGLGHFVSSKTSSIVIPPITNKGESKNDEKQSIGEDDPVILYSPTPNYNFICQEEEKYLYVKSVSCGYNHSLFLMDNGDVFDTSNSMKHTGDEVHYTTNSFSCLCRVEFLSKEEKEKENQWVQQQPKIKTIGTGYRTSYALSTDGEVYSWSCGVSTPHSHRSVPKKIPLLGIQDTKKVKTIACAYDHCIVLLENEIACYAWGSNNHGQLGIEDSSEDYIATPVKISFDTTIQRINVIATGRYHSLAIATTTNSNQQQLLYGWGCSKDCRLGYHSDNNERNIVTSPKFIPTFTKLYTSERPSMDIVDLQVGDSHSLALDKISSRIIAWGSNKYGQIGNGTTWGNIPVPTFLDTISNVVQISAGPRHSFAIATSSSSIPPHYESSSKYKNNDTSGDLYAWGYNRNGELGLRSQYDDHFKGGKQKNYNQIIENSVKLQPHKVMELSSYSNIKQISTGYKHTICLIDPKGKQLKTLSPFYYRKFQKLKDINQKDKKKIIQNNTNKHKEKEIEKGNKYKQNSQVPRMTKKIKKNKRNDGTTASKAKAKLIAIKALKEEMTVCGLNPDFLSIPNNILSDQFCAPTSLYSSSAITSATTKIPISHLNHQRRLRRLKDEQKSRQQQKISLLKEQQQHQTSQKVVQLHDNKQIGEREKHQKQQKQQYEHELQFWDPYEACLSDETRSTSMYCLDTLPLSEKNSWIQTKTRGTYETIFSCAQCKMKRICIVCAKRCHKTHCLNPTFIHIESEKERNKSSNSGKKEKKNFIVIRRGEDFLPTHEIITAIEAGTGTDKSNSIVRTRINNNSEKKKIPLKCECSSCGSEKTLHSCKVIWKTVRQEFDKLSYNTNFSLNENYLSMPCTCYNMEEDTNFSNKKKWRNELHIQYIPQLLKNLKDEIKERTGGILLNKQIIADAMESIREEIFDGKKKDYEKEEEERLTFEEFETWYYLFFGTGEDEEEEKTISETACT